MNWGKSIVLTFILFAGFIGSLVFLMSRQRVDLVRDDYYQDELNFQRQINRISNTARLSGAASMTYQRALQQVVFTLPASVRQGNVTFYRPADRRLDFTVPIAANAMSRQTVSTAPLAKGYWRVQLTWSDGEQEYYAEKELYL
ncbi:nitrogen fixation protein FixH [Fibrisoma montanum]|uniref:Nitrogen fixation protein FixH n=1 Tax=Fibrisoma montanum TaxID=2305895 RepID=A0A418LWS2_9BACT|nr:FixH family protein [Fibrisoma montanum]RIV17720.1 nitrogen fixation protein FixH [Fibrisoma montanum]